MKVSYGSDHEETAAFVRRVPAVRAPPSKTKRVLAVVGAALVVGGALVAYQAVKPTTTTQASLRVAEPLALAAAQSSTMDGEEIVLFMADKDNLCVDDGGAKYGGQTKFTDNNCDGQSPDQIYVYDADTSQFRSARKPGLCMDDGGGTMAGETQFSLRDCDASSVNQRFIYQEATQQIRNPEKDLCLDDGGGVWAKQSLYTLQPCDATSHNQRFTIRSQPRAVELYIGPIVPVMRPIEDQALASGGKLLLRAFRKSNQCIDDGGDVSAQFRLMDCDNDSPNQVFLYDPATFMFRSTSKPTLCMDDGGGKWSGQTKFRLSPCDTSSRNQKFYYSPTTLFFSATKPNMCIDDDGGGVDARIQLWDCNHQSVNQQFVVERWPYTPFVPMPPMPPMWKPPNMTGMWNATAMPMMPPMWMPMPGNMTTDMWNATSNPAPPSSGSLGDSSIPAVFHVTEYHEPQPIAQGPREEIHEENHEGPVPGEFGGYFNPDEPPAQEGEPAPIAEEPIAEEPHEEYNEPAPIEEEPTYGLPPHEKPIAEEPTAEEPRKEYNEPEPIAEEPIAEEPHQEYNEPSPIEEGPAYGLPQHEEAIQPVIGETHEGGDLDGYDGGYNQPEEPQMPEEPTFGLPPLEEPAPEEPINKEPRKETRDGDVSIPVDVVEDVTTGYLDPVTQAPEPFDATNPKPVFTNFKWTDLNGDWNLLAPSKLTIGPVNSDGSSDITSDEIFSYLEGIKSTAEKQLEITLSKYRRTFKCASDGLESFAKTSLSENEYHELVSWMYAHCTFDNNTPAPQDESPPDRVYMTKLEFYQQIKDHFTATRAELFGQAEGAKLRSEVSTVDRDRLLECIEQAAARFSNYDDADVFHSAVLWVENHCIAP